MNVKLNFDELSIRSSLEWLQYLSCSASTGNSCYLWRVIWTASQLWDSVKKFSSRATYLRPQQPLLWLLQDIIAIAHLILVVVFIWIITPTSDHNRHGRHLQRHRTSPGLLCYHCLHVLMCCPLHPNSITTFDVARFVVPRVTQPISVVIYLHRCLPHFCLLQHVLHSSLPVLRLLTLQLIIPIPLILGIGLLTLAPLIMSLLIWLLFRCMSLTLDRKVYLLVMHGDHVYIITFLLFDSYFQVLDRRTGAHLVRVEHKIYISRSILCFTDVWNMWLLTMFVIWFSPPRCKSVTFLLVINWLMSSQIALSSSVVYIRKYLFTFCIYVFLILILYFDTIYITHYQ